MFSFRPWSSPNLLVVCGSGKKFGSFEFGLDDSFGVTGKLNWKELVIAFSKRTFQVSDLRYQHEALKVFKLYCDWYEWAVAKNWMEVHSREPLWTLIEVSIRNNAILLNYFGLIALFHMIFWNLTEAEKKYLLPFMPQLGADQLLACVCSSIIRMLGDGSCWHNARFAYPYVARKGHHW